MTTALYRRYRPENFGEMIGQAQVTEPLMTALRGDRIGHAYLFSGPRGCGKTTSARILARCLNCVEGPTDTPCGVCDSCVELSRTGGGSLDVIEIDAASNNGVDDARALRERAVFAPARDRYKIFILDEAHMVTSQGFNALLKLVEEPPEHVKFIFATTEPDKVIGTIRSRTHHYPFRLVPPAPMLAYIESLCTQEGITPEPSVLPLAVRAGGGSPRDTLSILDQLIAGSDGPTVGYERAVALLGYTHGELLDGVVDAFAAGDAGAAFSAVDRVVQTGQDPRRFVDDLLERLRDLIIIAATGAGAAAVLRGTPADELERMTAQAGAFGSERLSRSADIVSATLDEMGGATSPRLQLELMIARVLSALRTESSAQASAGEGPPHAAGSPAAAPSAPPAAAPGAAAPGGVADPAAPAPAAAPAAAVPAAAPPGRAAAPSGAGEAASPAAAPAASPLARPEASSGASTAAPARPAAAPAAAPTTDDGPAAPRDAAEAAPMAAQTGVDPSLDDVPAAGWASPGAGEASGPRAEAGAETNGGAQSNEGASPHEGAEREQGRPTGAPDGGGPASPPAPEPVAPLSIERLTEAWHGIVESLREAAPQSAALVEQARPAEVRPGDVVMMSFPSPRHMGAFKGAPANDLRTAIAGVLGVQVKYLARVDPPPQASSDDVPPPDDDPEPGSYDDAYSAPRGGRSPGASPGRPPAGEPRVAADGPPLASAPVTEWTVAAIPGADPASSGAVAPQTAAPSSGREDRGGAALSEPAPVEPDATEPEVASDWGVNLSGHGQEEVSSPVPSLGSVPGLVSASSISAPSRPAAPAEPGTADAEPTAPTDSAGQASVAASAAPGAAAPAAVRPSPPAAPAAAPGAFAPPEPEPADEPEPSEPEDDLPPEEQGPTVQRRQVFVPEGVERRGEAVVRQMLGARFLHEEPYEPPTRFN